MRESLKVAIFSAFLWNVGIELVAVRIDLELLLCYCKGAEVPIR
jgi:hypothetical protein